MRNEGTDNATQSVYSNQMFRLYVTNSATIAPPKIPSHRLSDVMLLCVDKIIVNGFVDILRGN